METTNGVMNMSEKVAFERNDNHWCQGFVLYGEDTERSIASFWHDNEAESAVTAINNYDRLTSENARLRVALKECINELKRGSLIMAILNQKNLSRHKKFY